MSLKFSARLLGACALVSFALAAPALAEGPIENAPPVEAFAQLSPISYPSLSPNGSKIVAEVAVEGETRLMIIPLSGGGKPALIGTGDFELGNVTWVNEDWLVVEVYSLEMLSGYEDVQVNRALGVKADGSKIIPLLKGGGFDGQTAGDVIWTPKDGSTKILIAAQRSLFTNEGGFFPEVQEVDVTNGKHKSVEPSQYGIFTWYPDGEGVVRVGTGRTLERVGKLRVLYRPDQKSKLENVPVEDDHAVVPVAFLEGDKALAIEDDEEGYSSIYEIDLATLKLGKKLFGTPGYDVSAIRMMPDRKTVAGYYTSKAKGGIEWVHPTMKAMQKAVNDRLAGVRASISSTSNDLSRAIVRVGAEDTAGAWMLYDAKTGMLSQLANVNPMLGASRLNPVKAVRYIARDGLEIEAILTLPKGKEAKDLPIIALPHGGPFARDYVTWDWWTQHLASLGYAVIQPNFRGSSGYGTDFTEKGEGEWGLKMQDDIDDAVLYLDKEGIGDKDRTCISGASYGGYAAMWAAQRGNGLYRCAISYAGVSDLGKMYRSDKGLFTGNRRKWLKEQIPDFGPVSPINFPERFDIPILIVHGEKDTVVPVKQSRNLVEKLKAKGKSHIYIEQPEGDHHFSRFEDRLQFLKAQMEFLKKHNPS